MYIATYDRCQQLWFPITAGITVWYQPTPHFCSVVNHIVRRRKLLWLGDNKPSCHLCTPPEEPEQTRMWHFITGLAPTRKHLLQRLNRIWKSLAVIPSPSDKSSLLNNSVCSRLVHSSLTGEILCSSWSVNKTGVSMNQIHTSLRVLEGDRRR